jgi:hypothetical protein
MNFIRRYDDSSFPQNLGTLNHRTGCARRTNASALCFPQLLPKAAGQHLNEELRLPVPSGAIAASHGSGYVNMTATSATYDLPA